MKSKKVMDFKIEEIEKADNSFLSVVDKKSLSLVKKEFVQGSKVLLDFDYLCLGETLYGKNKKESLLLQKKNCKKVVRVYKQLVSLCRKINKKGFDGKFYRLKKKKKNNNDMMLMSMLELRFKEGFFNKMNDSIVYACDYLDAENELNKMCDLKDGKCVKRRANKISNPTLCCPSKCKYNCPCKTKNLACKLYMCEHLTEKGFCFSPLYIPVLKVHMTFFERLATWGVFFRSTKQTFVFMWFVRILLLLFSIAILTVAIVQVIKIF